jgi:hypothetical protein
MVIAMEEGDAKIRFQGCNMAAYRALRHEQFSCGSGETAGARGDFEGPQSVQWGKRAFHPVAFRCLLAVSVRFRRFPFDTIMHVQNVGNFM